MSLIQEDLQSLLATATGVSVSPLIALQDTEYPHVTYQQVVSKVENVLDGNGNPPINNTRMQVDCWAKTYSEAKALAAQVTQAMLGWNKANTLQMSQDLYESEVKVFRVMFDFSIWHH